MNKLQSLPPRIRTRVDYDSLNLSDVARGTGISISHINRVFNGNRTPSLPVLRKIAQYLKVDLTELSGYLETKAGGVRVGT